MAQAAQAALLFSVGPVQDFIATARKGQDLWFGSWLLSELSRTAAAEAQSRGATLIMPAPISLERGDAVANKVLALTAASDADDIARAVELAVRNRLADLAAGVFDEIAGSRIGNLLQRGAAERQVADLPEIAWVVVDEVAGDWPETRRRAEAALAARKSIRDFNPVTWGAPVPKSRLDGQRESVIDESAFKPSYASLLRPCFGVGPAERLGGVGLLKRNGHRVLKDSDVRGARVLSTPHLASWSLRRVWADDPELQAQLRAPFKRFLEALPDQGRSLSRVPRHQSDPVLGALDGSVLFKGYLAEDYDSSDLEPAKAALDGFLREARQIVTQSNASWPVLSPYYAILRADGDRMGAWLDGLSHVKDHQAASEALASFANKAAQIVEDHHGHCVFAGGDDVLALLPIATALACADALNRSFESAISFAPPGRSARPTLSVGIQIAHATEPFRAALDGAREAEHAAKHLWGRDAFAVRLDKRSGSPTLVGGKWTEFDGFLALQAAQEPGSGGIPRGLAYELRDLAARLAEDKSVLDTEGLPPSTSTPPQPQDTTPLDKIRGLEVARILAQKGVAPKVIETLRNRLGGSAFRGERLIRLSHELIITRALAALDGEDK